MRSPLHYRKNFRSRCSLIVGLVVIILSNLLVLNIEVSAIGEKESRPLFLHSRESVRPDSVASFAPSSVPNRPTAAQMRIAHSKLPLMFEANLGQTDSQVKFLARGADYAIFLTSSEVVALLSGGQPNNRQACSRMNRPTNSVSDTTPAVLRMRFIGGAAEPQVVGLEELRGKSNYFIGNNPEKWHTDVPLYAKVQYNEVYTGIDLVYYGNQRELEYDFVVAAGADPAQIRLSFDGAQRIRIDANGDLILKTSVGEVRQRKPLIYQEIAGVKKEIRGRYALKNRHEVGFALASYDREKPLIIDPILSYATYMGGSEEDEARAIAVDSNGYVYVTGYTFSAGPLPDTPDPLKIAFPTKNGFQSTLTRYFPAPLPSIPRQGHDAFVAKFDPTRDGADSMIYSTFLGGASEEVGNGIAVDSNGNAYITGKTKSADTTLTTEHEKEFPVLNAFQSHLNNGGYDYPISCYSEDAFVTKLNAAGNALLYSTYFGGSGVDEGKAIAVDSSGNAYVAGQTLGECAHLPDYKFPLRNELRPSYAGDNNGFVAKFNTLASGDASLIFSTMLGGGPNSGDSCNGIAVTPSGENIYVTGTTSATNFPTTPNAYQTQKGNGSNVFVTVIKDTRPLSLHYSTYLGGTGQGNCFGNAIAIDSSGNAYVTGVANDQFPRKHHLPDTFAFGSFVSKINPSEEGEDSLVYSTCLTVGSGSSTGRGIAVDAEGFAYVTGEVDTPTCIKTKNPIQPYGGGTHDAFVAKLTPAGNDLAYSTFLGGSEDDLGWGIAIDVAGNAYVAGSTESTNFPVTSGAFAAAKAPSSSNVDKKDAFMAKISEKQANLTITTTASPDPVVTGSNLTYTITVTNLGPDIAPGVVVTNHLASEVGFVSSTPATTGTYDRRMIRFDSVGVNESVTVTIVAMASCFASDGTIITNKAMVTSLLPDPDTDDNSSSLQTMASNPPPQIICPADIVSMSAIVNYPKPTVVDNCLGLMLVKCSPPSGSIFPVGTTTVICEITDAGGNASKCGFTVTVKRKIG